MVEIYEECILLVHIVAQQKELHKECNLFALIGAELGQQVEMQEECILFVQRLHTG